jgi:hypothetical protein
VHKTRVQPPKQNAVGIGDHHRKVPENILEEMDEDLNSNNDREEIEDIQCQNIDEEEKMPEKLKRKNFLYKRTTFRAMGEFFKTLFLTFVKKEAPGNKKVHMNFKNHI